MLVEKISSARMKLRKEKEKRIELDVLTTIYSDISLEEKSKGIDKLSDEEVIKILNKYKKNITENLKLVSGDDERSTNFTRELNTVLEYLPKQITTEELRTIIIDAKENGNDSIGKMMGFLKSNYNGQYNPKDASTIAKEIL